MAEGFKGTIIVPHIMPRGVSLSSADIIQKKNQITFFVFIFFFHFCHVGCRYPNFWRCLITLIAASHDVVPTHLCQPLRSTFAVRETASLGIIGAPRVPPLNPSESIVLSKHYRGDNLGKLFMGE